jgi:hypothetical protein
MIAEPLREEPFGRQLNGASSSSVDFSVELGSSAAPILGQYRHGPSELVLDNRKLQKDSRSEPDVGPTAAQARFVEAVQRLADTSVIDETRYDVSNAISSRTVVGVGSSDTDDPQERVVSYDFLVRETLNGIPFVNAGLRIGVHRTGAITGVRVGGAQAAAVFEGGRLRPVAPGYVFRATPNESYYQGRFAREFPRAQVLSQGLTYMLPMTVDAEAGNRQVLEPRYVFSFSNHYGDIVARRRYVGYSISKPELPAEDLSPSAEPNAAGDPRRTVTPIQPGTSRPGVTE